MVDLNGSTILMMPGKRILVKGFVGTSTYSSIGGFLNASNNSTITAAIKDQYWKGIETERTNVFTLVNVAARIRLSQTVISYAEVAVSNFSTTQALPLLFNGGLIHAKDVHFLNNKNNAARIYSSNVVYDEFLLPPAPPNWTNLNIQFIRCKFEITNEFPHDPDVFVVLNSVRAVPFQNCIFKGKTIVYPSNTTGIHALNSSIRVEPDAAGNSGGSFENLKNGIVIRNQLQVNLNTIINNAYFYCQNAVNLSGCVNFKILRNQSRGTISSIATNFNSFFLRNCPTFQLEGNDIHYDIGATSGYSGIVIMNSGSANNEVYRNFIGTTNLDIQSIGTNRSDIGFKGLKILCNNMNESQESYDDYNITVMKDIIPNTTNGIHYYQYVADPVGDVSAGNWFIEYPTWQPPTNPLNYYLENGTNNVSDFVYKFNFLVAKEEPVYSNIQNAQSGLANICISHNDDTPPSPFPFAYFMSQLNTFENEIIQLENKENRDNDDTLQLSYLLGQHSKLIDSIVNYHLDQNQIDSIALVYEQVNIDYQYKVLLALIYKDNNEINQAVSLLNSISDNYTLNTDEQAQIDHLATIFESLDWLKENDNNWEIMPESLKSSVFNFEQNDPMYAGAIARALLTEHEAYIYDPIALMPDGAIMPFSQSITNVKSNKIYPNPAQNQLFVNWNDNQSILILIDITGKVVLLENLKLNFTKIKIDQLQSGIYIAQIKKKGEIVYQQKIIKH